MNVVFYITGHGFGHAARVIEVINALVLRRPDLRIYVRTTTPRWLFDLTAASTVIYQRVECDTGIVQIDSLNLDEEASVRRAREFMASFDERVAAEAAALRALNAELVVADMPALGIAAATHASIMAVAMGNFTWDWAYSAYAGSTSLVEAIGAAYASAEVALRLPMWGGFDAFRTIVDLPFVARRSTRDPQEIRRALGLPAHKRLVLPSFGGHGLDRLDQAAIQPGDYHVIFDFDEKQMYADGFRYEDLVRAADVVVTKPGYGIIAECLANETAIVYTDRGHFIEYEVLVEAMPRFLRAAYISHDDLFSGRWQPHLDGVLAQPAPPERPATDGADVAAELLLEMLATSSRR